MKKIYTNALPVGASLKAEAGQVGSEILLPASSIGIPQKYTTVATPQQVALIGSEGIRLNVPTGSFAYVGGYLYYEQGAFDDVDVTVGGGNMVIANNIGTILTKQTETDLIAGNVLALQRYITTSSPVGEGSRWELLFDTAPTNTNFGRLQITLYLIPLDLIIP